MIASRALKALAVWIALTGTVAFGVSPATAAGTVTVGYNSEWLPFSSGDDSSVDGILVQLVTEIIESQTDYTVENVGLPWARVQRAVADGRIDAMVTFASDERLTYADKSDHVVFSLETKAFVRTGSDAERAIRQSPAMDTHRRFIHCTMLADHYSQTTLNENGITFATGRNTEGCIKQVLAGRQDVFLHIADTGRATINSLKVADRITVLPKVYTSVPLHFLLSKKSRHADHFLEVFDAALGNMLQDGRYAKLLQSLRGASNSVRVATLEWPPYTGSGLPNNGAITEIVRRAFEMAGIVSDDLILPWKRAIAYAESGTDGVAAYFPGYHCRHRPGFVASDRIGRGPLNLAERADADVRWSTLDDMAELHVGTVVGYANTEAFDARVADGRQAVVTSVNDVENLKKLVEGKIDLAIIDGYVFEHLMRTHPELAGAQQALRLDSRALETKNLFLCFRDDESGHRLRESFNRGLKAVDQDAIWRRALKDG